MKKFLVFTLVFISMVAAWSQDTETYANPQKRKIRDFQILYDSTVGRVPGAYIPLGIRLEKRNGSISFTKGYLKGKMSWIAFIVRVEGGVFSNGSIYINRNYQADDIKVKVYHKSDPSFVKELIIPMDYKGKVEAYITGYDGKDGRPGRDGYSTSSGNGTDGEYGEDGGDGGDAPELDVLVQLRKTDRGTFLVLDVTNLQDYSKREIKANIEGGSIVLIATGGKGGDGGRGGNGGPGTGSGRGGNGGNGGNGGRGGKGAKVTVRFTPEAKYFSDLLTVKNHGGNGGNGGKPGASGGAGPNRTYSAKTVVGKILEGAGNGIRGSRGNEGSSGYSGPPVEIIFLEQGETSE